MAGVFEETERLKIRFIKAYERLRELGKISEAELDEVIDEVLDRMDELSPEELREKLGLFKHVSPERDDR